MNEIRLIKPTPEYAAEIMCFREECLAANDPDGMAGCTFLEDCGTAEEWFGIVKQRECAETCPEGSVPSDAYLAVRTSDNRIVGMIDLRHHIDHPVLGVWGGHIGYTVRPSERGKGYACEMLRLDLENCRARGLEKVMVTCSPENPASEKTILANGGIFEKEILVDGEPVRRYWISL